MKFFKLLILLFLSVSCFGQNPFEERFNKVSEEELNMKVYPRDTKAAAVVLYEHAKKTFEYNEKNGDTQTTLHYYSKIKILTTDGLEEGNIVIPFGKQDRDEEEIINIKAITHNLDGTSSLEEDQIITVNVKDGIYEKKLLLPNVQVGSVIEFQYTLVSPFTATFRPWVFQKNIPKVHSEFNAKIPSNYKFARSFKGQLQLNVNDVHIEKDCFKIKGLKGAGSCEILRYIMKNIPAFKNEQYALSLDNYISKVVFRLSEFKRFNFGGYSNINTWKEFDKIILEDEYNIKSILKKSMFKGFLPKEILAIQPQREKAEKIYEFIRDHYTWNRAFGGLTTNKLRKAFKKGEGNIAEINLSLMNAMHAGGIHAEALLMATRYHSIPTQNYPVLSDFNYLIIKVIIHGKVYFLDASEKYAPFGIIPLKALNYKGRALDFVAESYWQTIFPNPVNRINTAINLSLSEDGTLSGKFANAYTGHAALDKRKYETTETDEYLDIIEAAYEGLEINDYKVADKENVELPLKEFFEFEIETDASDNTIYIDPFISKTFSQNPFQLEKREYPVDFAYPRMYTTRFLLSLPQNYEFESLPKDQTFTIGEDKAICELKTTEQNGKLNMTFTLRINEFHFTPEEYETLKDFFTSLVKIQNNTLLTIKKKNS